MNIKESKPTRYYTEEQVMELLKEQRRICATRAENYRYKSSFGTIIEELPEPNFPRPTEVVPVEKVKEVVEFLDSHGFKSEARVIKANLLPDGK